MSNPNFLPNPERPLERVDTAAVIRSLKARNNAQRNRSYSRRKKKAEPGEWQTGLCGCCGQGMVDANCIAFIAYTTCAPCLFGTAIEAAKLSKEVVGDPLGGQCYCGFGPCDGWVCCACCACPCIVGALARSRIRGRYDIRESCAFTLFAAFCCTWCSYVQSVNQILFAERKVFSDLYGSFRLAEARADYDAAPQSMSELPPPPDVSKLKVPAKETGLDVHVKLHQMRRA